MIQYMLDTNVCIYVMKRRPPEVRDRLRDVPVGEVAISAIVLAELRYGIAKSDHPKRSEAALADFLPFIRVLAWPQEAAADYGDIRAQLQRQGRPIGSNDLLIAAHARQEGSILVTNNESEFQRVEGLKVENWILPPQQQG